jgi:hypothetical protein
MMFRLRRASRNRYAKPTKNNNEVRRNHEETTATQNPNQSQNSLAQTTGTLKTRTTKNEMNNAKKNPVYERETTTKINETTTTTASSET